MTIIIQEVGSETQHIRVTDKETVKQGVGAHYFKAYASASQTKVWLMCENNNFNGETYRITGYWDEETWD